jgi:mono/diheme cytochrome c family protein
MNTEQCKKYSGKITAGCFNSERTRFKFQCQFSTSEYGVSMMYFDEKNAEDKIVSACTQLKGRLTKLESFISRKPDLKRGRSLYEEKGCIVCHGAEGKGDGQIAPALSPKPGDFTIGFLHGDDLDSIIEVIMNGVPNTAMAPYHRVLEDDEINDLARYVKHLSNNSSGPLTIPEKKVKP